MFQPMPIPFDDSCCLRISHFGPVPQLKSSLPSPRNAFRLARSRLRYKSLRPLACQSSSQSGVPAVRILKVAQQPRQIKREIVSFISNLFLFFLFFSFGISFSILTPRKMMKHIFHLQKRCLIFPQAEKIQIFANGMFQQNHHGNK